MNASHSILWKACTVTVLTFIIGKLEVVIHGGNKLLHKEASDARCQMLLTFHLTLQHVSVEICGDIRPKTQYFIFLMHNMLNWSHRAETTRIQFWFLQEYGSYLVEFWYDIMKGSQWSMSSPDFILSRIWVFTYPNNHISRFLLRLLCTHLPVWGRSPWTPGSRTSPRSRLSTDCRSQSTAWWPAPCAERWHWSLQCCRASHSSGTHSEVKSAWTWIWCHTDWRRTTVLGTNLVWLFLVVDEILLHVEQRLVVVHVLGQVRVTGVLLQEGVGCCYGLLHVVVLWRNTYCIRANCSLYICISGSTSMTSDPFTPTATSMYITDVTALSWFYIQVCGQNKRHRK